MTEFWWNLPGPSAFLEQAADDLREGKCLVLCLPEHGPEDLPTRVRRQIDRDWRRLRAEEMGDDPAEALYDYFAPDSPPETRRSCRTLVALDRFLGQAVMVEIRCPARWNAWREFLIEYEERVRATSPVLRALLCIVLIGETADSPPPSAPALVTRRWDDVVSEMDTALWTSHLLRGYGSNPTIRCVAASVVTRLSLWDPELPLRFSAEKSEHIFQPIPLLREVARERGWDATSIPDDPWPWCRGLQCSVDGRSRGHSAALAAIGRQEEIEHRVWAAQVSVLFPFVEERRRGLINGLGKRLSVPFRPHPDAREITDPRDLELSHIHRQIRSRTDVPAWLPRAVDTLVGIRNDIAHFEIVPESALLDENLRLLMRSVEYEAHA